MNDSSPDSALALEAERLSTQREAFGNRLKKNLRKLASWTKRAQASCYRVYDCDIPELPLTLDRYESISGEVHGVLHYWEGRFPHSSAWLEAMCDVAAQSLQTTRENIHLKHRARQEGKAQYERLTPEDIARQKARRFEVKEAGLSFLVNLEDYIDTGLFIDHRESRSRFRAEAAGKDVLNLFAYTGAFSVYAAAGGARSTLTVDLSQTYLDWAADNLALNGFQMARPGQVGHHILRADVLSWLYASRERSFDLAIVDPPTFSNSKRMQGSFDVGRDQREILHGVASRMRPGGVVYFSTNFRRFKPDPEAFRPFVDIKEYSEQSVPPDFRDRKIHRAWRLVVAG